MCAQNQYGTDRKLVATPAARVEALKNSCSNIAQAGDVRLKVLAGIRDAAQVGSKCTAMRLQTQHLSH